MNLHRLFHRLFTPVFNLQYFAEPNTQVTTQGSLSDEMKTYYSDYLIDLAGPKLVHDQFAQKHPIPKNSGKTIEFRKYSKLGKRLTPLTEGVTPDGQSLSMSVINATISQYGGYITISDLLELAAVDNNIVEATKQLADQAGGTLDTISREALAGGSNVIYGENAVTARSLLTSENKLTVNCVERAVRFLKTQNAPRIDGYYVAIIHPDSAYDLMQDTRWQKPHEYVDTSNIYDGEIGRIAGCRFVESTEAKIFHAENLAGATRNLVVNGAISTPGKSVTFDGGTVVADALIGRYVIINGIYAKVLDNTTTGLTLDTDVTAADNALIYPGEAGAAGRDVYATIIMGADAYGTTELTGGGLQTFVKQKGSAGTADPIDQRSTVGWKATKVTKRLVEEYMVRIETCSTFESGAN